MTKVSMSVSVDDELVAKIVKLRKNISRSKFFRIIIEYFNTHEDLLKEILD